MIRQSWRWFVRHVLHRAAADEELDAEIRTHLARETERRMDAGESLEDARRGASRDFGNVLLVKEVTRDMWGWGFVERWARDLRYGVRTLRKAPGFAALVVLTLALGIGATTAIFTVVNGVLLKPLPFENQDELVSAGAFSASDAHYFTYRDAHRVFEDIGLVAPWPTQSVTGLGEPELVDTTGVTASLLPLLRVQPVIGRRFTEEDESPGTPLTIMLSYAYWQRQFGADPAVVGRMRRTTTTSPR